ncbi:hypothetical protein M514_23312 [Trichuris suis]|uniref:Uncharacterized protein n=1 Tax=Trichuris suis TaxID=68888 RepID=A0A085N4R9_9BILA|nr:hypothetical protein M514_23312 [Trichuris suis]
MVSAKLQVLLTFEEMAEPSHSTEKRKELLVACAPLELTGRQLPGMEGNWDPAVTMPLLDDRTDSTVTSVSNYLGWYL